MIDSGTPSLQGVPNCLTACQYRREVSGSRGLWKFSCLTNVDCSIFAFMERDYQFFSVYAIMAATNKSLLLY